jgi:hypothetical protein
MFDPSACFGAYEPATFVSPPEPPPKVPRVDHPTSWVPLAPTPPTIAADDGVPSSLPVFVLPPLLPQTQSPFFNVPDEPYVPEPVAAIERLHLPENDNDDDDPRRIAVLRYRSPWCPRAGLMRDDGGIFKWLDAQRDHPRTSSARSQPPTR